MIQHSTHDGHFLPIAYPQPMVGCSPALAFPLGCSFGEVTADDLERKFDESEFLSRFVQFLPRQEDHVVSPLKDQRRCVLFYFRQSGSAVSAKRWTLVCFYKSATNSSIACRTGRGPVWGTIAVRNGTSLGRTGNAYFIYLFEIDFPGSITSPYDRQPIKVCTREMDDLERPNPDHDYEQTHCYYFSSRTPCVYMYFL
jgi:hypothetical protein